MALTKGVRAITQLAASDTSTVLDVSAANSQVLGLLHFNGTGAVTAPGSAEVQWMARSGTHWYSLTAPQFSSVDGATDTRTVAIPDAAASVRIIYTQPTGPTGMTLDAEVATETL